VTNSIFNLVCTLLSNDIRKENEMAPEELAPEEHTHTAPTHTEPIRVVVVTEFVPARDVPARGTSSHETVASTGASTELQPAVVQPVVVQPAVVLLTLRALRGETCIFDVGFTTEGLRVYAVPEYQPLARTVAGELLMYTAQETRWEMIVQWMLAKVAVVEMGVGKVTPVRDDSVAKSG
jgi:hypothetical protein